ncbi:substrate-binding domain-containing protein [Leptolyngbya sp. FACHB-261]|uniref:substrate-binding domain-containing protein n=1 Tax=Leptolyngbya sp. FACHB-261 TaxID=2692806 RepID=UPI001689E1A6|nr:substrate-binding domain-containing protein [Leptolyngbya sp. FACHB-261]MBD2100685.1 substrate-binding domain-containing protein [Leptolyngbya sp. FACHB-261]
MSKSNNETPVLLASLVVTLLLAAGLVFFLGPKLGLRLGGTSPESQPSAQDGNSGQAGSATQTESAPAAVGANFKDVPVPSGLFSYGGSTTWAPIRQLVDSQIQSARPEFQLRYTSPVTGAPGSSTGIRMLLNGELDFAQSSRPLQDSEYQAAQQRGFALAQSPVAIDGIAVVVNPNLNLPGLTIDQLRQIYRGQVNNWSQVGGPNLPITPFSRRVGDGGTAEFLVENVLQNQAFGPNVQYVATTTEALRKVSSTAGGVYYASAPEAVPQCGVKPLPIGQEANQWVPPYQEPLVPPANCPAQRNQLNGEAFRDGNYPLTRKLFVVVKQQGREQEAGEAYSKLLLTDQGQKLIEQAGFIRLR